VPRKVLARGWELRVGSTNGDGGTEVKGINSFTFASNKDDAETTTFDSEGWAEHLPAERGRSVTIEGFYLEEDNGDRDPGQEEIDDLGELMGHDGLEEFTIKSPGGTEKYFMASVNPADVGGGNNDPTSWGAELTISGKVETV